MREKGKDNLDVINSMKTAITLEVVFLQGLLSDMNKIGLISETKHPSILTQHHQQENY